MTTIESTKVNVNASPEEVFEFLKDMRNVEELLPKDKISNWEADAESCSFKIQNTATISLVQHKLESPDLIQIKSGEKSPFPFDLDIHVNKTEEGTLSFLIFNGDLNPFLKMMAVKPLTNLFNYMAERLQKKYQ